MCSSADVSMYSAHEGAREAEDWEHQTKAEGEG